MDLQEPTQVGRGVGAQGPSYQCTDSVQSVRSLLHQLNYRLQANKKTEEGAAHPDRDAQFLYINQRTQTLQERGQPVVWVDTKKKELVGNYKNGGREWCPQGEPEAVLVHDFVDEALGKAIPYGVYDLSKNAGWVSVGVDHDTAQFAVATLLRWWEQMGKPMYPEAEELQVMADGGGSNSTATAAALACGRWPCSVLRMPPVLWSAFLIFHRFHRARASGTRLSTGCSASSP